MTHHLSKTAIPATSPPDPDLDEFEDFLQSRLADPTFAVAFEDAAMRSRLIADLVTCRKAQKLKQREVAGHMGVSQSVVSEFENSEGDAYFSTLQRYARALGARLTCKIEMPADQTWASHVVTSYSQREPEVVAERPVVQKPGNPYLAVWAKSHFAKAA
jgi:transcriptional regulator with XRE-family HTH domain